MFTISSILNVQPGAVSDLVVAPSTVQRTISIPQSVSMTRVDAQSVGTTLVENMSREFDDYQISPASEFSDERSFPFLEEEQLALSAPLMSRSVAQSQSPIDERTIDFSVRMQAPRMQREFAVFIERSDSTPSSNAFSTPEIMSPHTNAPRAPPSSPVTGVTGPKMLDLSALELKQ